jgi:riboflavin biosynthesis pyrimidine reductase
MADLGGQQQFVTVGPYLTVSHGFRLRWVLRMDAEFGTGVVEVWAPHTLEWHPVWRIDQLELVTAYAKSNGSKQVSWQAMFNQLAARASTILLEGGAG